MVAIAVAQRKTDILTRSAKIYVAQAKCADDAVFVIRVEAEPQHLVRLFLHIEHDPRMLAFVMNFH